MDTGVISRIVVTLSRNAETTPANVQRRMIIGQGLPRASLYICGHGRR